MEQHPIQVVVVAVFQLPKAGQQTCRRSCQDALFQAPPLAVTGDGPLDAEKVVLARDGVATPITIAHRIGHTLLRPLIPAPWRVQRDARMPPHRREYLPIVFEPELMGVQPSLHEHTQLFELALARPKDSQVVHVADIVLAQPALTDEPVHRLQDRVGKPLRGVGPNLYAVLYDAPDEVENAMVFNELAHTVHHDLRLQAVVEMPDVSAELILRPARVFVHPDLDGFPGVMRTTVADAPAAVVIHAAHEHWLQDLNQRVVDVLVRPLGRLTDRAPLPGAGVPPLGHMRFLLLETGDDDLPQLHDALLLRFLHPCSDGVRTVVCAPVVGAVHLVDGKQQVVIRYELLKEILCSLHRDVPPFSCTGFPAPPQRCTNPLPKFAYLHQGVRDYLCREWRMSKAQKGCGSRCSRSSSTRCCS